MTEDTYREHLNALQVEIEALRAQLKEAQTGDLISRAAAIKAVDELPNCYNGFSDAYDKSCIIGLLEELPTIEERKTGEWGHTKTAFGIESHCPYCGWKYYKDMPFCAQCGANMGGEQHDSISD